MNKKTHCDGEDLRATAPWDMGTANTGAKAAKVAKRANDFDSMVTVGGGLRE